MISSAAIARGLSMRPEPGPDGRKMTGKHAQDRAAPVKQLAGSGPYNSKHVNRNLREPGQPGGVDPFSYVFTLHTGKKAFSCQHVVFLHAFEALHGLLAMIVRLAAPQPRHYAIGFIDRCDNSTPAARPPVVPPGGYFPGIVVDGGDEYRPFEAEYSLDPGAQQPCGGCQ